LWPRARSVSSDKAAEGALNCSAHVADCRSHAGTEIGCRQAGEHDHREERGGQGAQESNCQPATRQSLEQELNMRESCWLNHRLVRRRTDLDGGQVIEGCDGPRAVLATRSMECGRTRRRVGRSVDQPVGDSGMRGSAERSSARRVGIAARGRRTQIPPRGLRHKPHRTRRVDLEGRRQLIRRRAFDDAGDDRSTLARGQCSQSRVCDIGHPQGFQRFPAHVIRNDVARRPAKPAYQFPPHFSPVQMRVVERAILGGSSQGRILRQGRRSIPVAERHEKGEPTQPIGVGSRQPDRFELWRRSACCGHLQWGDSRSHQYQLWA
jgi:hypothetical protein